MAWTEWLNIGELAELKTVTDISTLRGRINAIPNLNQRTTNSRIRTECFGLQSDGDVFNRLCPDL